MNSSIDKFRSNPTQNIGEGYYPFGNNYNNFVAFQHPPSQPVDNDFTETKGVGNPILILNEPLPVPYTSVEEIRPNPVLNSDEIAVRMFNLEQEQLEQEADNRKELQMDLQTQINMKDRMMKDYQSVIERNIYEISSSSMPTADKILRIHELMREADSMGLSPNQAQPLLLETMNKYGLSVGFEGVIEELRRRQPPLAPQTLGINGNPNDLLNGDEGNFGATRQLLRNREGQEGNVESIFEGFYQRPNTAGERGEPIIMDGIAPMGMGEQMSQPAMPSNWNASNPLPSRPVDYRFGRGTGAIPPAVFSQQERRMRERRDRELADLFRRREDGGAVETDEMRRYLEDLREEEGDF